DELCRRLDQRIGGVRRRMGTQHRPTVFLMEWAEPIFNSGHWNPELIRLAGGALVLSREGEYSTRVAWEDLRAADPEILVIACCGHGVERTRQDLSLLEALPGWRQLQAVRNRKVYLADGSAYFSRPGPRIVDSLEVLGAIIHRDAGGTTCPGHGVVPAY